MSSSDTGFDWFSILAILVAGGIGLAKSFANKSKNQNDVPRPFEVEYENKQNTEEEERTVVEGYGNLTKKENRDDRIHFEPIFEGGDYYKQQPELSIEFSSLFKEESEEEEEHPEFDGRQAIISSEILRRPQY